MKTKILPKKRLQRFIYETLKKAESNPSLYTAEGLADTINYRVDLAFHPLEEWITVDGGLESITEIVGEMLE